MHVLTKALRTSIKKVFICFFWSILGLIFSIQFVTFTVIIAAIISSHHEFPYHSINYQTEIYPVCENMSEICQIAWLFRCATGVTTYMPFPILYYI